MLLKIWLIGVGVQSALAPFIFGFFAPKNVKRDAEKAGLVTAVIGSIALLWPLVLTLGGYWAVQMGLLTVGIRVRSRHEKNKELKLQKVVREEAKAKQDKLYRKAGD